jgi:hypothetical protein
MKAFDNTEKLIVIIKIRLLNFCTYNLKRFSITES